MTKDKISVVIPVYNSSKIVEKTVSQTISELSKWAEEFEIILVNDGSPDNSWQIIKSLALSSPHVVSINLLKNYGQHTAVFCGIKNATGKYIITMDDDLQNPPSELIKLYERIKEGYDLVFAKFESKKHSSFRILGSKFVNFLNRKIFNQPKDLTLSNFRIFSSETGNRAIKYKTNYPYIPGLLLMHAGTIGNVTTKHQKREIGGSNYTISKIFKLVTRLLINYSSLPLKLVSYIGISFSLLSLVFGIIIIINYLINGVAVPGWTSIIVLLSLFNSILIILIGVLGVYVSRILQQVSNEDSFHVTETIQAENKKYEK